MFKLFQFLGVLFNVTHIFFFMCDIASYIHQIIGALKYSLDLYIIYSDLMTVNLLIPLKK